MEKTVLSNYQHIENIITSFFEMSMESIKLKTRRRKTMYARQAMTYLLCEYTHLGCAAVGEIFEQSHGTALHSVKTINRQMKLNHGVKIDMGCLIRMVERTDPPAPDIDYVNKGIIAVDLLSRGTPRKVVARNLEISPDAMNARLNSLRKHYGASDINHLIGIMFRDGLIS